jgi:hypothetical protein
MVCLRNKSVDTLHKGDTEDNNNNNNNNNNHHHHHHHHEETTDHLNSGCPVLAKNEYLFRHDKVQAHLHHSICKESTRHPNHRHMVHTHTHKNPNRYVNRKM